MGFSKKAYYSFGNTIATTSAEVVLPPSDDVSSSETGWAENFGKNYLPKSIFENKTSNLSSKHSRAFSVWVFKGSITGKEYQKPDGKIWNKTT